MGKCMVLFYWNVGKCTADPYACPLGIGHLYFFWIEDNPISIIKRKYQSEQVGHENPDYRSGETENKFKLAGFILRAPTKQSSGPRKPRKVQDKTETTSEITVLDWATQKTKQIQVPSSEVSSVVSWALAAPSNSRRVGERFCWAITLWTQETRIFTPSKILPCISAPYKPVQKDMRAQANSRTSVGCFNIFWSKQASFRRF